MSNGPMHGNLMIKHCLKKIYPDSEYSIARMPSGKPYVLEDEELGISVSHSAGLYALLSSRSTSSIGVDIQKVDEKYSRDEIAKLSFCGKEIDYAENGIWEFFSIWASKEAYVKAKNLSLSAFKSFSIFDIPEGFSLFSVTDGNDEYALSIHPGRRKITLFMPSFLKIVPSDTLS